MASLQGTKIKNTYPSILKVGDNGELEATAQEITDGAGNGTGVSLNTSGDVAATGTVSFGSLKDSGENITITKFVDEADGIANNDNDSSVPTSAAVRDYVDNNITAQDLDISDGTNSGSVDLDSQVLTFTGDAGVSATVSGQTLTLDSSALQSQITANDGDITTLQAADVTLQDNIDAEEADRIAADGALDTLITAEQTARIAADTTLQTNITAEATARTNADTALQTQITSNDGDIAALNTRVGTAEGNITNNDTDIAALDTRLTTAEGNITSNDTDISGLDTRLATVEANQGATGIDVSALEDRVDVIETDITTIEGDITGLESSKQSISEKGVAGGYASLDGSGVVPTSQLPEAIVGALQYKGTWNAATDTPTLPTPDSSNNGWFYKVSVEGTYNSEVFHVGDWAVSDGTIWDHIHTQETVSDVFGREGSIVAVEADYSAFYPLISDLNTTNTNVSTNASDITALDGRLTTAEGEIDAIQTKTNFISVTQAVSLDTVQSNITTNTANISSNDTDITALQTGKYDKTGGVVSGDVTANSFIKSGGTASQFLKADGSVDSSTYLTSNAVDSVNSQTGTVVLDADDIDDTSTANKFTSQAEIDKLAGIEALADVTDVANVTTALNSISVTEHSDVTDAGSGQIITAAERTQLQGADAAYTVSAISTNTNAVKDTLYLLTASLTLTLPASPSAGDKVAVSNMSGATDSVVARNGENIAGLAEDLTIDVDNLGIQLVYTGATKGWVLL